METSLSQSLISVAKRSGAVTARVTMVKVKSLPGHIHVSRNFQRKTQASQAYRARLTAAGDDYTWASVVSLLDIMYYKYIHILSSYVLAGRSKFIMRIWGWRGNNSLHLLSTRAQEISAFQLQVLFQQIVSHG